MARHFASSTEQDGDRNERPEGEQDAVTPRPVPGAALALLGQENETLRSSIARLGHRLGEVALLQRDFAILHDQVAGVILDYPQVQAQLAERTAALQREQGTTERLDRELRALTARHAGAADDFAAAKAGADKLDQALRQRDAEVAALTTELSERLTLFADLERGLAAGAERARIAGEEAAELRAEVERHDAETVRLERDLAGARDATAILANDYETARATAEETAVRLGTLTEALAETRKLLDAARARIGELESALAAGEVNARRLEAERDADRAQLGGALAAHEVQAEALRSRCRVTETILDGAREQVRERNEEIKAAERVARDATIKRQAGERRLGAAEAELARALAQAGEGEKARVALAQRCEMLEKTLAAKDANLDAAEDRAEAISRKLDQLTQVSDGVRASLEHRNRTLSEELARERSERTLAQGALEAARRARGEAERELNALRRVSPGQDAHEVIVEQAEAPADNVRLFKAGE